MSQAKAAQPEETPLTSKVDYQLKYLNTDVDINRVVKILQQKNSGRFLFYGVAGSGKSLLGEYIAKELDAELEMVTASDISARYNGESEQNIRQIFDLAEELQKVLLIDEIGYFLTDRRNVAHSWETSTTNEFLTRLELFNGIVIGTTNYELEGYIDHAFYRRFDLKIKFNYLKYAQAKNLFDETLKQLNVSSLSKESLDSCYKELSHMVKLTPADFSLAVRKAPYLYDTVTPETLLKMIKDEVGIKPDVESRRIGF